MEYQKEQMEAAFNEWMRRYIEEPERFDREFQVISKFLMEQDEQCIEPNYGRSCVAYLTQLIFEAL